MTARPQQCANSESVLSIEAFEAGSVDPDQFDHEAHIFVAWLFLQEFDLKEAIDRFCGALKRLTKKLGIETKYHETITWFFMISINERLKTTASDDWNSFKRQNPELFATAPSIISRHYSEERLKSPLARTQFLLPDRIPL